ncbi:Uma2 family endonuclease [Floridanema evergladense]|uniref:Uma2 family endonuclease n=1 Tax=Floridaenema evergladense BLCC-F167 TaxID=3153639 RepID=A0ABV4WFC8_9CYAN
MIQAIPKSATFDQFVAWYPENSEYRYELHNGVIVEMPLGTGDRSDVAGFISGELFLEIRQRQLPYLVPKEYLIKSSNDKSGYLPDVLVLDRLELLKEPRWKKESIITMGSSIRLAVEVVSTNWRDDYGYKLIDYEALGIAEYWIVDYLGLGGRRYIGNPKRPTLSVYELVEGEYQIRQFREDDRIESPNFPGLSLTARQIFQAGISILESTNE